MSTLIQDAFEATGAEPVVETAGNAFEINVRQNGLRGAVSHPDHKTIYLQEWHRVVQNNEAEPTPEARQFTRMLYFD